MLKVLSLEQLRIIREKWCRTGSRESLIAYQKALKELNGVDWASEFVHLTEDVKDLDKLLTKTSKSKGAKRKRDARANLPAKPKFKFE